MLSTVGVSLVIAVAEIKAVALLVKGVVAAGARVDTGLRAVQVTGNLLHEGVELSKSVVLGALNSCGDLGNLVVEGLLDLDL